MAAPALCLDVLDGSRIARHFQVFQIFKKCPTLFLVDSISSGVSQMALSFLDGSGGSQKDLGVTESSWMNLEVSKCLVACLNSSRIFGHRHVLACQSCRCQAGIAHDGLGDEVVVVREQLGVQGYSVLRYGVVWVVVNPSISHWWGKNHLPMAHRVE